MFLCFSTWALFSDTLESKWLESVKRRAGTIAVIVVQICQLKVLILAPDMLRLLISIWQHHKLHPYKNRPFCLRLAPSVSVETSLQWCFIWRTSRRQMMFAASHWITEIIVHCQKVSLRNHLVYGIVVCYCLCLLSSCCAFMCTVADAGRPASFSWQHQQVCSGWWLSSRLTWWSVPRSCSTINQNCSLSRSLIVSLWQLVWCGASFCLFFPSLE